MPSSSFHQYQTILSTQRHRLCVVMSGKKIWTHRQAVHWIHSSKSSSVLWVGSPLIELEATLCTGKHISSYLGQEYDAVVLDLTAVFSLNVLAAVAGTIRAGGWLILLTPDWVEWGISPDVRSIQRLKYCFQQSTTWVHFQEGQLPQWPDSSSLLSTPTQIDHDDQIGHPHCLTVDQSQAVEAIIRVVKGHRRRPLVIQSDRGRGKTTALGIALAELLAQPPHPGQSATYIITAPLRRNLDAAFQQLHQLLPEAIHSSSGFKLGQAELVFLPPDALTSSLPEAALVLVDEAAAIPEPLLAKWLDHYSRIVFATTVQGYEGSGRGFEVRFKAYLDHRTPHWQSCLMTQPIRWGKEDPLEQLIFDLLLLNAEPLPASLIKCVDRIQHMEWLDRDSLVQNESLLKQLFGLLVLAHYQTRPEDLRILLDDPGVHIGIMRQNEAILGVFLGIEEGDFQDAVLIKDIVLGKRRPKGNLIPQALASQCGLADALPLKYIRVMRMAVHPRVQRKGIGGQMLTQAASHFQKKGVDILSTSFGATPDLIRFWRQSGLRIARMGVHKDAASGENSVMMLKPMTEKGQHLSEKAQMTFYLPFVHGLPALYPDLSATLIAGLLVEVPIKVQDHFRLTDQERQDVEDYVSAFRPFETVFYPLWKWIISALMFNQASNINSDLLIQKVILQKSWHDVAKLNGLTGRKQVEQQMKEGLRALFPLLS